MQIIPAIDILEGKCVRLTQGNYNKVVTYSEDPLLVAKGYEDAGVRRLHLVDLDGARERHIVNYRVLEQLTGHTNLHIDFGGGIKTDEDLRIAFEAGAQQVTGGSVAVKNPALFEGWLKTYGSDRVILGADARNRKIAVSGWQEDTDNDILHFLKDFHAKSAKYAICTDVAKDGLLQGPSLDLYRDIREQLPDLQLIASGGISNIKDIEALAELNVYGVIIGKALYEGHITLRELEAFYT